MSPPVAFKVIVALPVASIAKSSESEPSFKVILVALSSILPVDVVTSVWDKLGVFADISKDWSILTLLTTVVTLETINPSVSFIYVPPAPEIVDKVIILVSSKLPDVAIAFVALIIKPEATISINDSPPSMIEFSAIKDIFPKVAPFEKIAPTVISVFALYEISFPAVCVVLESVIIIAPVVASISTVPVNVVIIFLFWLTVLFAKTDTEPLPAFSSAFKVISVLVDFSKTCPVPLAKIPVVSFPPSIVISVAVTIIWPFDEVFKSSNDELSNLLELVPSVEILSTVNLFIFVTIKASVSII